MSEGLNLTRKPSFNFTSSVVHEANLRGSGVAQKISEFAFMGHKDIFEDGPRRMHYKNKLTGTACESSVS